MTLGKDEQLKRLLQVEKMSPKEVGEGARLLGGGGG